MKLGQNTALLRALGLASALAVLAACSDDPLSGTSSTSGAGGASSVTSAQSSTSGTGGAGGMSGTGGTSSTSGVGGAGGGAGLSLDTILDALRQDLPGAMQAYSSSHGWPIALDGKVLFVSTKPTLNKVAGDHDAWGGTAMTMDSGFTWAYIAVPAGEHYKFTDGTTWEADPWSRSYTYDAFGEISLVEPADVHLDRYFAIGDAKMQPRTVRIWVPKEPVTHLLYVHDGQNLFDPDAIWGGWHLQDSALPGMMLVGIDNTVARMDEYTHVQDVISTGSSPVGGLGDAYGDFLENTVRPMVKQHYGEPQKIGLMGSSLGGLISLHVADRFPGTYVFAASLSGTVGWGSIGDNVHNETIIERYMMHGHQNTVLYVDSGGNGTSCVDADGDGINDDDPNAADNFCENIQMRDVLKSVGYVEGQDLFHWWEQDALHNEAAWAARVNKPLGIFQGL